MTVCVCEISQMKYELYMFTSCIYLHFFVYFRPVLLQHIGLHIEQQLLISVSSLGKNSKISTSTKSLLLRLYCPTFTLIAAIPALSLVAATFKLWKTTTCCSQQFTQQIIF